MLLRFYLILSVSFDLRVRTVSVLNKAADLVCKLYTQFM